MPYLYLLLPWDSSHQRVENTAYFRKLGAMLDRVEQIHHYDEVEYRLDTLTVPREAAEMALATGITVEVFTTATFGEEQAYQSTTLCLMPRYRLRQRRFSDPHTDAH